MKIDVKNLRGVSFETLDNGDVFDYGDILWMKMEELDDYNAVALDDGSISHFGDGDEVYVVNVKLVNA